MTVLSTVDFEDETDGAALANLPTDWTEEGPGTALAAEADAAVHGSMGMRLPSQASGYRRLSYAESVNTGSRVLSFYITPRSFAGANTYFAFLDTGIDVRFNSDNTITLRNGSAAIDTTTEVFAVDTTYRCEWRIDFAGDQELRIYEGDATTALDTLSGACNATSMSRFLVGQVAAVTGFSADFDTIKVADDWTGPHVIPNVGPTASFTHTEDDLTVSVDASGSTDSDGTIVSYSWDWGDGSPDGSGSTDEHTYASAGTYTITLTVTDDDDATDDATDDVTVTAPNVAPTASFTVDTDDLTVSVDGSASSDSDGTIVAYNWGWGDGNWGSGVTAQHTYDSGGEYTITLIVVDDDGAEDTATDDVTVTAPASGTAGNPGDTLTYSLNRLAGTLENGVPTLEAQGAANKWAGTTGLALVGALNVKNGSFGLELQGVLNELAGTYGLGPDAAAALIDE